MTLRQALERLLERRPLLIGFDFDGTLAPLVEHPSMAVPVASATDFLSRLADRPGITVVVVSGRALSDLVERLGEPPGVVLIGEHGNDTGETVAPSPTLEEATRLVETLVAESPGSFAETKPRSVTFHYRNVPPGREGRVLDELRRWAETQPEIRVLEGNKVIELTIATGDKGDAIKELAGEADGTLYIGDDTTDETVFAVLGPGDVGIKVGPGETLASYRVGDVAEVVGVLEVIDLILA